MIHVNWRAVGKGKVVVKNGDIFVQKNMNCIENYHCKKDIAVKKKNFKQNK